jgi:hypothetical protein
MFFGEHTNSHCCGTSGETLRVAYHADDGTGDAQKVVKRVFFSPIGNYTPCEDSCNGREVVAPDRSTRK